MDRIFCVLLLSVLFCGCRQGGESPREAMVLCGSVGGVSKTDALTAGDAVAVYARLDGTEDYFLEAAKFATGADGQSLQTTPAVYYPETKQAVNFYAYFPYHTGIFSVPSDQSTAAALKQADLCWATTKSTPVPTPVSLQFSHLLARLIVHTNEPTEKIACQVVPSGTLNPATGQFTLNNTPNEVFTTGTELILPVQPLSRLVLTVSNIEYVFEGSISLLAGQTTTINLTLNPSNQTATLNGSSTTDWTTSNQNGTPTEAVSNLLTLHWANYVPQGATPDKITLTINNTDYTISSGITYADKTFTVPFASEALRYPYTITKIVFSNITLPCTHLLGEVIYKPGTQSIGIKDVPNAVQIGNLWWATGNLIANSPDAGAYGQGGCRIGAPGDGGLYFQFGSLIGYKGGAQANGGTGVGIPQAPLTTNDTYWNGVGYSWVSDAMVWPTELVGTKATWTPSVGDNISTLSDYYFNYSVAPWATQGQNIRDFSVLPGTGVGNLGTGRYAAQGVGDPCTYYLGGTWRLPTGAEYAALCNNRTAIGIDYSWADVGGSWTDIPVNGGNFSSNRLFFPASGYRIGTNGSFYQVAVDGFSRSSSVIAATTAPYLAFSGDGVQPQSINVRSCGFPVRCVRPV